MGIVKVFPYIYVLYIHWVGDFLCQTNKMAQNKSKSLFWLSVHVLTYTGVLLIYTYWPLGFTYALYNGAAHFVIDYFTSKITSRLYQQQDYHNFFVVIGLDQFLHTSLLIWTLEWTF